MEIAGARYAVGANGALRRVLADGAMGPVVGVAEAGVRVAFYSADLTSAAEVLEKALQMKKYAERTNSLIKDGGHGKLSIRQSTHSTSARGGARSCARARPIACRILKEGGESSSRPCTRF